MASTSKGKGTKGLKGMWKKQNKNVSVKALTRNDRAFIKSLRVAVQVDDHKSKHGNSKSVCWSYFGKLCYLRDSDDKETILNDRLYCSLCLQDIQSKAHSEGSMCHISSISNFSLQTSTGNLNLHLNSKHGIQVMTDNKLQQIVSYFRSYSGSQSDSKMKSKPPTEHEFNRDLAILFCRSLLPFSTATNEAFRDFLGKYLPDLTVPCASTLSGTALNDIYTASVAEIRKLLDGVRSICVMTDGWTDRYKAKPYMAIRISFVKHWQFYVITLSCDILAHHTGEAIANAINTTLVKFCSSDGADASILKKIFMTTCHDGAANVVKASKLLRSNHFQHCMGHALHLLISVDSLSKIEDITTLLEKCRKIVTKLHFRSSLIADEKSSLSDKMLVERLKNTVESLELDDQFPVDTIHTNDDEIDLGSSDHHGGADAASSGRVHAGHVHQTLKQSIVTRWNSNVTMIESVLDLKTEVHNALLKTGNSDLCLFDNEVSLLGELREFLQPFQAMTELISGDGAGLSLQPLVKAKIKRHCLLKEDDDPAITLLKTAIMTNIDKRLVDSHAMKVMSLANINLTCMYFIIVLGMLCCNRYLRFIFH